jgi:hypothetical protein
MDDVGHWTWSTTTSYTSSESSAEWILEAPTVAGAQSTLANTGTTQFITSYYVQNGTVKTIAQGDPTQIDLSPAGLVNEATPSGLESDGQTFDVCAYKNTCATP